MWMQLWMLFEQLFPFLLGYIQTSSFPHPLNSKEEQKMLALLKEGDQEARNKLIEHNLRLVVHIVKKFDIKNESFEDLISIGTIGLIKAIDTFDNSLGHRLTTYAARCIENEILMTLRSHKKSLATCSLDDPIGFDKDGESISLIDVIKDETLPNVIENMELAERKKKLKLFFNRLTPKEQRILIQRYGLQNQEEKTQKEIAQEENISRSYVSRIEKRAFIKLIKAFRSDE